MNIFGIANFFQRILSKSPLAVRLAILLRNQCRCVIKYYLNEGPDPTINGELWLARTLAPTSSTFIDVGANVGNWASLFMEPMSENSKGLLFEPSDYAIEKLKQRFEQVNGIEIIEAAVSDTSGNMFFYEEPIAGEKSSLVAGFSRADAVKKLVKVTTLDAEVEKYQLEHIDFLKIDTEGYDLYVLRGASNLLAQNKIGVIQFEYNSPWALTGSTLAAAFQLLESFGYKVFLLKNAGLFELNYKCYGEYFDYSNFVAVSPHSFKVLEPFIKGIL